MSTLPDARSPRGRRASAARAVEARLLGLGLLAGAAALLRPTGWTPAWLPPGR
ncbi:MAG TPA: hypothetical protein VFH03_23345 [Actinoplanes sp.]|nr:hypothetical protein [Actinoplanes sp.]